VQISGACVPKGAPYRTGLIDVGDTRKCFGGLMMKRTNPKLLPQRRIEIRRTHIVV
jgi:hypothetical protein